MFNKKKKKKLKTTLVLVFFLSSFFFRFQRAKHSFQRANMVFKENKFSKNQTGFSFYLCIEMNLAGDFNFCYVDRCRMNGWKNE